MMKRRTVFKALKIFLPAAAALTLGLSAVTGYAEETTTEAAVSDSEAQAGIISSDSRASGLVQVMLGYEFTDGSFDPWISSTGIAVGKDTVMIANEGFNVTQELLDAKFEGYSQVELNVNEDGFKDQLTYKVYDGNFILASAEVLASDVSEIGFLKTDREMEASYTLDLDAVEASEKYTILGVWDENISVYHYVTETDISESTVVIRKMSDGIGSAVGVTSGNYLGAPVVNNRGELVGMAIGSGTNCMVYETEYLKPLLDGAGITYTEVSYAEPESVESTVSSDETESEETVTEVQSETAVDATESRKINIIPIVICVCTVIGVAVVCLFTLKEVKRYKKKQDASKAEQKDEPPMDSPEYQLDESSPEYNDASETVIMESKEQKPVTAKLVGRDRSTINIDVDEVIIGRIQKYCTYTIDSNNVSKKHCRILRKDNRFYIEDLNSTNKTLLNGNTLEPGEQTEINNGNIVTIANLEYKFKVG